MAAHKTLQRDYIFHAFTQSLCGECETPAPAKLILQEGQVRLLKRCPLHGEQRELLEEDAGWYLNRYAFDKPGNCVAPQTPVRYGCPDDCGLCPDHEQHTCIGVLEITGACNLGCSVCYADAGPGGPMPLNMVSRILASYQESEGSRAEVLQLSGGEPTLHPDVLDIVEMAQQEGIRHVMLNTNGLRIAEDRAFAEALGRFQGGFEIYLQCDGLEAATHRKLRGQDLTEIKARALSNLAEFRVPVTLVATICNGVNDHEIGRLVEFGIGQPCVRGINFQPMAFFGRMLPADRENRITLTGILRRIEEQTGGLIGRQDFVPLPCDTDRVAFTYLYRRGKAFKPLFRPAQVRQFLPLVRNTLAFYQEDFTRDMAGDLRSASGLCSCASFLKAALPLLPLKARSLASGDTARFLNEETFRITVTSFSDRYNFDMRSIKKECVHILTPDLRKIPFSVYNIRYRSRYASAFPELYENAGDSAERL
ncbi:MAG: radical SAM protein [Armatimonadetes bacterium]|nr:radical SAM protein [Armatimonadota bacterium]